MNKIFLTILIMIFFATPTLALDCKSSDECSSYGIKMFNQKEYKTAIKYFSAAIIINPNDYVALTMRAKSKFYLGYYDSMIEDTSNAIKIYPYSKAYGLRGSAKLALGDNKGAIEDTTMALKLEPEYMKCYEVRARAENNLGYYVDAMKDANKALQLREDYPKSYEMLAVAQVGMKDYNSAVNSFEKSLDLFKQNKDKKNYKQVKKQLKKCKRYVQK